MTGIWSKNRMIKDIQYYCSRLNDPRHLKHITMNDLGKLRQLSQLTLRGKEMRMV